MKHIKKHEEFSQEERDGMKNQIYLKSKITEKNIDQNQHSILEKIKKYDFSNFFIKDSGYGITVYPDSEFISLIVEINETIEDKINTNINFGLSVLKERLNVIDLDQDFNLPYILRNLSIGYKIYKLMIKKFKFITSDYGASREAINIWYHLMCDKELYCFTSNYCSGVIWKDIENEELKNIISLIKKDVYSMYNIKFDDIIFDNQLKMKIKEFYENK